MSGEGGGVHRRRARGGEARRVWEDLVHGAEGPGPGHGAEGPGPGHGAALCLLCEYAALTHVISHGGSKFKWAWSRSPIF